MMRQLDFPLKLGQSTSLLNGYKADVFAVPSFTPSKKPALVETPITLKYPNYDAKWDFPVISLHSNTEDLLSSVLQVKIRPSPFEDTPSEGGAAPIWPAGALALAGLTSEARLEAVKKLSGQLGLDLSNKAWSYVLVRQKRLVGTSTYKCYERGAFNNPDPKNTVLFETLSSYKLLEKLAKHSTDVTMDGANGYLDFIDTFGSHIVSRLEAGDSLFQVFAYAKPEYDFLAEYFKGQPQYLSGPMSFTFSRFTVAKNKQANGYTAAAGNICIASGDPELAKSLESGLWLDKKYAQTNSIFTPFLQEDGININVSLTKITVIFTELATLGIFAEYYRMLIWRRVFKGAMYAKYATGYHVAPYFSNNCPYDLEAVYKDCNLNGSENQLSTLATPQVHLGSERIDLSQVTLTFPELVRHLSLFANAIQIPCLSSDCSGCIEVPGSSSVTVIGHVISTGTGAVPPSLQLSESAFNEIKNNLFCGEFYGGLRLNSGDSSKYYVVMNGLIFENVGDKVSVVNDTRLFKSVEVFKARFIDLKFALVAAEARLDFLLSRPADNKASLDLMKRCLLWIGGAAGSNNDHTDSQVTTLQARAMYLAKVTAMNLGEGVPVPYLKYNAYIDVISNVKNVTDTASVKLLDFQQQIRERMTEEQEIDGHKESLNKNLIKSGNLLLDYIKSQAGYQQNLADMFAGVVNDKKREFKAETAKAAKLSTGLEEQRTIVEQACADYKVAYEKWVPKETTKAAINIALNVFKDKFTFLAPAGSILALQRLGETVQKIQKVVFTYKAIINAYQDFEAIPDDPQQVVNALGEVGLEGLVLPSIRQWDEMEMNMDVCLAQGPDIPERKSLTSAFSILVLRGKESVDCQSSMQKIAADLSTAQQRIQLSNGQNKQLNDLKVNLDAKPENLDVANIDLIGLSGQLLLFQRQMLMTLASTVAIQDRVLQYEYLRPPTAISSFTMLNLQVAILSQPQSINRYLTVQPAPADQEYPIVYEIHGVKPQSITNNRSYSFQIDLNKREFASFNYVRVKQIEVEIGGIVSTQSGKYNTELTFDGHQFYDRGFNGEPMTYQTSSRMYTGLQDVSSSSHVVSLDRSAAKPSTMALTSTGNNLFGDKMSLITPFSTWKVSLPATSSNQDITFDDCLHGVTVRVIFHILAQLKEPSLPPAAMFMNACKLLARGHGPSSATMTQIENSKQALSIDGKSIISTARPSFQTSAAVTTSDVTTGDVLQMMEGKSVCAGWDAVFSMTVEEVNNQLMLQWQDRTGNPDFFRETGLYSQDGETSTGVKTRTEFNFTFDAPRLQFLQNNNQFAEIKLAIIHGVYSYSISTDDGVTWIPMDEAEVKQEDGSYVKGSVPLAIMTGSVNSQNNVSVKLNEGNFTIQNFEASTNNPSLSMVLTNFFGSLEGGTEIYYFGTIDYADVAILDALKPTQFQFNICHTQSNRDLLQIFIATTGDLQSAMSLYLQEPIPTNFKSSLIINTKIFFENVLPYSIGDGGIGLKLKAIEPADNPNKDKVWGSTATAGSVTAGFPEVLVSEERENGATGHYYYNIEHYIKVDGNQVSVDLNGMVFQFGDFDSKGHARMLDDIKDLPYPFQYGTRVQSCDILGCSPWGSKNYKSYEVTVNINMNSILPLTITGSGPNQMVMIASDTNDVILSGNIEPPPGPCETSDHDLQVLFMDQLNETLPPALKKLFNQPFESVSLFALNNILFPGKNFIDMSVGYVPGDMVIFGNFTDEESQSTKAQSSCQCFKVPSKKRAKVVSARKQMRLVKNK